jgi:hypothetical protein
MERRLAANRKVEVPFLALRREEQAFAAILRDAAFGCSSG